MSNNGGAEWKIMSEMNVLWEKIISLQYVQNEIRQIKILEGRYLVALWTKSKISFSYQVHMKSMKIQPP